MAKPRKPKQPTTPPKKWIIVLPAGTDYTTDDWHTVTLRRPKVVELEEDDLESIDS